MLAVIDALEFEYILAVHYSYYPDFPPRAPNETKLARRLFRLIALPQRYLNSIHCVQTINPVFFRARHGRKAFVACFWEEIFSIRQLIHTEILLT